MGFYIQTPAPTQKARQLERLHGARVCIVPRSISELPFDKALICVVANGPFDAAALIYDDAELRDFMRAGDRRPKTFLLMDKTLAHKLSGYNS